MISRGSGLSAQHLLQFAFRSLNPFESLLPSVIGICVASNSSYCLVVAEGALRRDIWRAAGTCLKFAICLCFPHLLKDLRRMLVMAHSMAEFDVP